MAHIAYFLDMAIDLEKIVTNPKIAENENGKVQMYDLDNIIDASRVVGNKPVKGKSVFAGGTSVAVSKGPR